MRRYGPWLAAALVVGSNLAAWGVAALNRRGEPEAVLVLTERECRLPARQTENTALTLALVFEPPRQRGTSLRAPGWFDRAKLEAIGFDCSRPVTAEHAEYYRTRPPRAAFAALEYGEGTSLDSQPGPDRCRQRPCRVAGAPPRPPARGDCRGHGRHAVCEHSRPAAVPDGPGDVSPPARDSRPARVARAAHAAASRPGAADLAAAAARAAVPRHGCLGEPPRTLDHERRVVEVSPCKKPGRRRSPGRRTTCITDPRCCSPRSCWPSGAPRPRSRPRPPVPVTGRPWTSS